MDAARGDAHRVLGLDLGGTNIKWTVLQVRAGDEVESIAGGWEPTDADGGPEVVTERLLVAGRTAVTAQRSIRGCGRRRAGDVQTPPTGAIELFPNLPGPWPGFPLRERLARGLSGCPSRS